MFFQNGCQCLGAQQFLLLTGKDAKHQIVGQGIARQLPGTLQQGHRAGCIIMGAGIQHLAPGTGAVHMGAQHHGPGSIFAGQDSAIVIPHQFPCAGFHAEGDGFSLLRQSKGIVGEGDAPILQTIVTSSKNITARIQNAISRTQGDLCLAPLYSLSPQQHGFAVGAGLRVDGQRQRGIQVFHMEAVGIIHALSQLHISIRQMQDDLRLCQRRIAHDTGIRHGKAIPKQRLIAPLFQKTSRIVPCCNTALGAGLPSAKGSGAQIFQHGTYLKALGRCRCRLHRGQILDGIGFRRHWSCQPQAGRYQQSCHGEHGA